MRGLRARARHQRARTVPADESAAGLAGRVGTRGPRRVVLNVSSDAAINAYPRWGAYGASKAALASSDAIWNEEMRREACSSCRSIPGDMDTPMHALALPDADRATLKQPARCRARDCRRDCGSASGPVARRSEAGLVIAADKPVQRSAESKLLHVDAAGRIRSVPRTHSSSCCGPAMS